MTPSVQVSTPVSMRSAQTIIGEPEVVEDATVARDVSGTQGSRNARSAEDSRAWLRLKAASTALQKLQSADGSIAQQRAHPAASALVANIIEAIRDLAPLFPHDAAYLEALPRDFSRWEAGGFAEPDFLDSLLEFQPQQHRIDGVRHLVVFPMYTQNGSTNRFVEAVLVETIWPEFIAELEAGDYSNRLFVSLRLIDFTPGYDTNSAVLFPETVAMREIPAFTWGAIFQDREAARFRRVTAAATEITKLELPEPAVQMLVDQTLTEKTFVMWDLIHDRTHMRGELPFDPFMIKQRMPFFLYSLEELRCDLTAFREAVKLKRELDMRTAKALAGHGDPLTLAEEEIRSQAELVQYAVIFDRIFRFAITGTRVRNYDGLGGQLLFAWLHQRRAIEWRDVELSIDWDAAREAVLELGEAIDDLYWRSIDRPKTVHWLQAYELIAATLTPNPASQWAAGLPRDVLAGPPRGYTDLVMDDEFPLSMFFEALHKKMKGVIESTAGIRGTELK